MVRGHVLKFSDGPIPTMTYWLHHSSYQFDPYMAYLHSGDDTPIGQADFVGVEISVGFPARRKKHLLIFPTGEIEFDRDHVWVNRTVFIPAHRLPNGRDIAGRRITKHYASKLFLPRLASIREHDICIQAWAEPHVRAAMENGNFRKEMAAGFTKVCLALDTISTRPSRKKYEDTCHRFRCQPRTDDDLFAVKSGNRAATRSPQNPRGATHMEFGIGIPTSHDS